MQSLALKKITPVNVHPDSLKHLKRAHPWILVDSFTKRFPREVFLKTKDPKSGQIYLFLHDWKHKRVKGRLWKCLPPHNPQNPVTHLHFASELYQRLQQAFNKRERYKLQRENQCLVFGENDLLPGLFIYRLKDVLQIRPNAYFWKKWQPLLKEILADLSNLRLWWDYRTLDADKKLKEERFVLEENQIKFEIRSNCGNDIGLYTDMAAIREILTPQLKAKQSLLNLYSYTGAFSLSALRQGLTEVVSVDVSRQYMQWLEHNLELNQFANHHQAMIEPVETAIQKLTQNNKQFDWILCDPPSSSNDGQKQSNILRTYPDLIRSLLPLTHSQTQLVFFLNTHNVTAQKFQTTIEQSLRKSQRDFQLVQQYALSQDCKPLRNFPEGNYLKGLHYKLL